MSLISLKTIVLLCLILNCFTALSQESQHKYDLGVSAAFGKGTLMRIAKSLGSSSIDGKSVFKLALDYTYQWNDSFGLETGLEYLMHKFSSTPAPMGIMQSSTPHEVKILSLPAKVKYTFANYFYFNGGALLDLDIYNKGYVNNLSGIGVMLGAGAQYAFKKKTSIFINPQIAIHSLLSFSGKSSPRRLYEDNITFGIRYQL